MDQLVEIILEGVMVATDTSERSDEGMKLDAAGKVPTVQGGDSAGKVPALQGGDSEEEMPAVQGGDSEDEMPSILRSVERLQFHAAGKRPAVQGADSVEEMEMPSNRVSDEGLQLHMAGQRPEDDVMRSELLQILMRLKNRERLFKLLPYVEEYQLQNQENQLKKQKVLQILVTSMQPSTVKEMLATLRKYGEENQPQKQENQPQKQNKKHHRKSRMPLRKIAMEKVKKSNLEKQRIDDKEAAYLAYLAARAKDRELEDEQRELRELEDEERELEYELESRNDWHANEARLCRDRWNESSAARGKNTYETITSIPPMRFTDRVNHSASPCETLQIFSVKVAGVKDGVHWPLYVYGTLAVRDTVDRKRNIIFDRKRDNFQTVTKKDPYLTLTGPSRAAVLSVHHSYIEADLKIKDSSSDSDDKDFSYLATGYIQTAPCESFITKRVLFSRLSTLELTAGHIVNSVEATIIVEVRSGKWPSGYGGVFMVSTASMDTMEIVLLSFGADELPLEDDGKKVRLSRSVVGVEVDGSLNVVGKALPPRGSSEDELSGKQFFTPKKSGRSHLDLKVGSCEMKVSVAWSLLLTYDYRS